MNESDKHVDVARRRIQPLPLLNGSPPAAHDIQRVPPLLTRKMASLVYADSAECSELLVAELARLERGSYTVRHPLEAIHLLEDPSLTIDAVLMSLQDASCDIVRFFAFLQEEYDSVRRIAFARHGEEHANTPALQSCAHQMILWDPWQRDHRAEVLEDALNCRRLHAELSWSDIRLIESQRGTNPKAIAALIRRYRTRIGRLAADATGNTTDTEDLVQDIYLDILRLLPTFDGTCSPAEWLDRVAMSHVDSYKARGTSETSCQEPEFESRAPLLSPAGEEEFSSETKEAVVDMRTQSSRGRPEVGLERSRRLSSPNPIGVDIASAFAGDRRMTSEEATVVREQQASRGEAFFSDLIYAVSHHHVGPEQARALWREVMAHKGILSDKVGREVCIAVAMLDYLSDVTGSLKSPTLMSEAHVAELMSLSMRDGMTGLYNYSTCYELLELELANQRRYGGGVALLMLDIDNFKGVNDVYGHLEGDRILTELATAITDAARCSDICCRLGGDEFAVILRTTKHAEEACAIGERIRARASNVGVGDMRIAISVGVGLCNRQAESPRDLVQKADRALYDAKRSGGNRVILNTPGSVEVIEGVAPDDCR